MKVGDILLEALGGLRVRPFRTVLTVAGIAIGVAVIVGVVGLSASAKAGVIAQLDALGTDLLRVTAGSTLFGEPAKLPVESPPMVRRIAPVDSAAAVASVQATVRRSDLISELETGALAVVAAEASLGETLQLELAAGAFLGGRESLPGVVLGSTAASRLGITDLRGAPRVLVGGHWLAVIGLLEPTPLTPEIDRAVLLGLPLAAELFGVDGAPTTIYVRARPEEMNEVMAVLSRMTNPLAPNEVTIERPADALEARATVDESLTRLLLALGAVVVLVAAVGVLNVMATAVLERRSEIGIRRALGARRAHVAAQFLVEAILVTTVGGLAGVVIGSFATVVGSSRGGWSPTLSVEVAVGALAGAMVVGVIAGVQPAIRAALLDPAEAVHGR